MRTGIIHSVAVCLAVLLSLLLGACDSNDRSVPDEPESVLLLNIGTIGGTRAGTQDLPDNEKMNSLRVIILHQDGRVEHNRFYSREGALVQRQIVLKVTPDEKKRIYLFANEESVSLGLEHGERSLSDLFDGYIEDSPCFEDAVKDLYFAPDYSGAKPIPMSSMYEIDFPAKGNFNGEFYLVRVATKFTVNFRNMRGEPVTVNRFSIRSHADKNFLMAHVDDSDRNRLLFNGKTWVEWLKEVSDASSANDDYAATEAAGWLKDYRLPEQADRQIAYTSATPVTVGPAEFDVDNLDDIRPGTASETFYLPESINPKESATDGEQEYAMSVHIDGVTEPFDFVLPNLKALFRNTNVIVNITMTKDLQLIVEVIPFTSVEVAPDFGLVRDGFTGYIVGKDSGGRKCWYDGNYYDPNNATPLYLGPNGNHGNFVTINGKEYLLVYADYARTAANLDHIFEKETGKKYLLYPAGRTGYENVNWTFYLNGLRHYVWLSEDYNEWDVGEKWDSNLGKNVEAWFWKTGTTWYRTLNEWDRLDWNKAIWDHDPRVYPRFWFDVLGNRYPWSEGDTKEKRAAIIKEWVGYLE